MNPLIEPKRFENLRSSACPQPIHLHLHSPTPSPATHEPRFSNRSAFSHPVSYFPVVNYLMFPGGNDLFDDWECYYYPRSTCEPPRGILF